MSKLSFKEYLESKQQLVEALKETPVQTLSYSVKKYCTLIVGEKADKQYVPLKPNQQLVVEWRYDNVFAPPNVMNIFVSDQKDHSFRTSHTTFWEGIRLQKWLKKNAEEQ